MAIKLGEMLVKSGLISQEQLQEALDSQKANGEKLGFSLIKLGYVKEDDITQLLSEQFGVPSINLRHFEIDESVINLIPSEVAQKYLVLPVNRTGATLKSSNSWWKQASLLSRRFRPRPSRPPLYSTEKTNSARSSRARLPTSWLFRGTPAPTFLSCGGSSSS